MWSSLGNYPYPYHYLSSLEWQMEGRIDLYVEFGSLIKDIIVPTNMSMSEVLVSQWLYCGRLYLTNSLYNLYYTEWELKFEYLKITAFNPTLDDVYPPACLLLLAPRVADLCKKVQTQTSCCHSESLCCSAWAKLR